MNLKEYNDLIKKEIYAVKKELSSNNSSNTSNTNKRKRFIVVSFKVDEEFFNKYLADIEHMYRSQFIRDAIVFYRSHIRDYAKYDLVLNNSNNHSYNHNNSSYNNARKSFVVVEL